jgi:hypothetical protein
MISSLCLFIYSDGCGPYEKNSLCGIIYLSGSLRRLATKCVTSFVICLWRARWRGNRSLRDDSASYLKLLSFSFFSRSKCIISVLVAILLWQLDKIEGLERWLQHANIGTNLNSISAFTSMEELMLVSNNSGKNWTRIGHRPSSRVSAHCYCYLATVIYLFYSCGSSRAQDCNFEQRQLFSIR